jgi:hypothetical protein
LLFITLAGPFAHRRFAPRSNWLTGDFVVVEKMIFGKGSKGTAATKQKYLTYIVDHAEGIVDDFWADIRVAAKALLKHETLTGDEISAVIRAAQRKSRRRRRIGDPLGFAASWRRGGRCTWAHLVNDALCRLLICTRISSGNVVCRATPKALRRRSPQAATRFSLSAPRATIVNPSLSNDRCRAGQHATIHLPQYFSLKRLGQDRNRFLIC